MSDLTPNQLTRSPAKRGMYHNPKTNQEITTPAVLAGYRHQTAMMIERMVSEQAEGIAKKLVETALTGDVPAIRVCLDKILPDAKWRTVKFELPEMKTMSDTVDTMRTIIHKVADGELTIGEGKELAAMVVHLRENMIMDTDLTHLLERMQMLEERNAMLLAPSVVAPTADDT